MSDQTPEPSAIERDPRDGGAAARLFRGFGYLFAGWGFVFGKHPSLIKYCLIPLLINLLVFAGVAVALYFYYGDLVALIWAKPDSWFLKIFWYLLYVFIFIAVMLLAYFAFFVLQAILSAPFNDLLSERVEQLARGNEPPPFSLKVMLAGLGRTLLHESAKLAIYIVIMVPLFVISLVIPVLGQGLFVFGGGYMTAKFIAYDFMDFAMARRQWPFRRKWRLLKDNRALTIGFGSSLTVALLLPVIGLLCVPMAAVGGTLLFCDLDKAGALDEPAGGDPAGTPAPVP